MPITDSQGYFQKTVRWLIRIVVLSLSLCTYGINLYIPFIIGVPFSDEGTTVCCHQFVRISERADRWRLSDHRLIPTNQRLPSTAYQLTSSFVSIDRHRHSYNERAVSSFPKLLFSVSRSATIFVFSIICVRSKIYGMLKIPWDISDTGRRNSHSFVHSSYFPQMSLLAGLPEGSGGRVRSYPQPTLSSAWLSMLTYHPVDKQVLWWPRF
jgi:hypothetical protein